MWASFRLLIPGKYALDLAPEWIFLDLEYFKKSLEGEIVELI